MSSRVVVLGGCGAWPEAGRACSGFVVEHHGFRVVLDLGYGTLPRLFALLRSSTGDGVDAVIVTHDHPDHMVDLHGFFRARWFGARDAPAVPLYAPAGVIARLVALEDDDTAAADIASVLDHRPLPAKPYELGTFALESWALPHHVVNAGVRLTAAGLTIAYSGDTGPDPALAELGRDADLFIVEASDRLQGSQGPPPASSRKLHLSASEAGEAAAAAGARRLMLTHFWPGNDRERSRRAAARAFSGEILLADEGLAVSVG